MSILFEENVNLINERNLALANKRNLDLGRLPVQAAAETEKKKAWLNQAETL